MMFFAEWNVILFLCSPIMNDIASLTFAGLYINDLAMHDFSRDLLLTGKKYFMADTNFVKVKAKPHTSH